MTTPDQPTASPAVVDLTTIAIDGQNGVAWKAPNTGDLNTNLVHLNPDTAIDSHRNREVDVTMVVIEGEGSITIDGATNQLVANTLALVPKGSERSISASPQGLTFVTVHRRRGPLSIGGPPRS